MLKDFDRGVKVIMAGSSGVGKSSLLLRFVDDMWSNSTLSTIGVDFKFKNFQVKGQKVKLQIWDTAGSEQFRSIVSAYYRGADAVVLVFDLTNPITFEQLKQFWIEEVKKYREADCELMLIGNKSDIDEGAIGDEEIKKFLKAEKIQLYKETSAKTGDRVGEAFKQLTQKVIARMPKPKKERIQLEEMSEEREVVRKKKCCLGN